MKNLLLFLSRSAFAVVFISTCFSLTAIGADFYGIIDNFGNRTRNAFLNVSIDTMAAPSAITFDVSAVTGGPISHFLVTTNANGFASTTSYSDLFAISGGAPMLIRARTPLYAQAAATLHFELQGKPPVDVGLWPADKRDGSAFSIGSEFGIALGTYRHAYLLIANVGGGEQAVDVHKGTRGADGSGIFTNPRLDSNAVWRVDLTQNEALSNLVVSSTGPIIVELVTEDSKALSCFQVLPSV